MSVRSFTSETTVRLGDVARDGTIRLAALARHLQDVAFDDVRDAGLGGDSNWVVRRVALDVDGLPGFGERILLETSCTGIGPRWAERVTDVRGRRGAHVASRALWVFVDASGRPRALPAEFRDRYPVPDERTRISPKLHHPGPPASVSRHPWPLRAADFDVMGHMNNAAYWDPIDDEVAARAGTDLRRAELEYRAGIAPGDAVTVAMQRPVGEGPLRVWLESGGEVRASAQVWGR